jgi:hypothetical protein
MADTITVAASYTTPWGTTLGRPIEGDWPYLWLDATYVKVREAGQIVSVRRPRHTVEHHLEQNPINLAHILRRRSSLRIRSRPSTWWNLLRGLRWPRLKRIWVEVAGFRWWRLD